MALFFLDPNREPRECQRCHGTGVGRITNVRARDCHKCSGTGTLGEPGAKADVVVAQGRDEYNNPTDNWHWSMLGADGKYWGEAGFPTESAALAAARKAAKGEE